MTAQSVLNLWVIALALLHLHIISIHWDFSVVRILIAENDSVEHEAFGSQFVEEIFTFESVEKGNQDVDSSNDKDIETCVEKLGFRVC